MEHRQEFDNFDPQTAMRLRLQEALQLQRSSELLAHEAGEMATQAAERLSGKRYSVERVISIASLPDARLDGIEREVSQELARQAGMHYDPQRPWIPWSALGLARRTLSAGTAADGGDLIGQQMQDAVDVLRPHSTMIRMGAQTLTGLVREVPIPTVTTNASAEWLAELGTGSASSPVFGQYVAEPKLCMSYLPFSKWLMRQSPQVSNRIISGMLLGAVGAALDTAALSGTGTSEPTGIDNWSGVTATVGTGFDGAASQAMLKAVSDSNCNDDAVRFLGNGAGRELLAQRSVDGTAAETFIWQNGMIASKPAAVSGNVGTDTLYCGDWSQLWLLLWGGGVQLEINPFENFQGNIISAKVTALADVAVVRPSAFAVSTGIT